MALGEHGQQLYRIGRFAEADAFFYVIAKSTAACMAVPRLPHCSKVTSIIAMRFAYFAE